MFIRHSDMKTIGRLRREQGLLRKSNWEKAIDKCDPALRGLFEASQKRNAPVPEVYWEIEGRRGEPPVAVLEAAWPQSKVGVSISEEDIKNATEAGWQVYTMSDALDNINIFVQKIATRF